MKASLGIAILLLTSAIARGAETTIAVPPYLEMIVFDVFHASAGSIVEVFPPGSTRPIRDGIDGVESVAMSDLLTTLAVARPRPGPWRVRKTRDDESVRVRSQQFYPRGALLEPDPAKIVTTSGPVRIVYRVLDGAGQPIEELADHPLSLEMTLAAPDGRKLVLPMRREPGLGAAAFRSAEDAHCPLPGRYWTDVRVTTVDASGTPLDLFRDRWSGFTVAAPHPAMQAHALPRGRPGRSLIWRIGAIAAGLLIAGAIVRQLKN